MAKKEAAASSSTATATSAPPSSTPSRATTNPPPAQKPEWSKGPFPGGYGVSIFRNMTNDGRPFRSIIISPRRYQDNGEWKDAKSFREGDIDVLIMGLEAAKQYCKSVPLVDSADGFVESLSPPSDDVPF